MKIGIVSDIHCNAIGLQLALDAMGDVDEVLCLGDAIYEYQFSNDVVRLLRDRGAHIIQGNHEEVFLSSAGSRARERPGLDPDLIAFLAEQPLRKELLVGGKKLLMVHSTPWEPRGEYVHPHSTKLARPAATGADVARISSNIRHPTPGAGGQESHNSPVEGQNRSATKAPAA